MVVFIYCNIFFFFPNKYTSNGHVFCLVDKKKKPSEKFHHCNGPIPVGYPVHTTFYT